LHLDTFLCRIDFEGANMRKALIALSVLVLLALNWAALHDILKGEQNVWMEWSVVLGSALLLIIVLMRKIHQPV